VKPFASYVPTRLYFGVGETRRIGTETAGIGKKALLMSGKGAPSEAGSWTGWRGCCATKG